MLENKFSVPETIFTTTASPSGQNLNSDIDSGPSNIRPKPGLGRGHGNDVDDDTLSDVVAALVSAILAVTFLLLLFCIIRVIRKRRRQLQGQRLNQPVIQTISPGAFTASTATYSQHIPTAGNISWERVDTQARTEPSRSRLHSHYYRLRSGQSYSESHDYQFPGPSTSSSYTQPFQESSELYSPGTSPSLPRTDEVQPGPSQEMLGLSAQRAPSSSLQMVQVDAVLHHSSFVESQGASGACASSLSTSDSPLPSLPPPLFGSSYHQWTSLHEHELPGNELCGAPVEQVRPVRTFGHQHRPSQ